MSVVQVVLYTYCFSTLPSVYWLTLYPVIVDCPYLHFKSFLSFSVDEYPSAPLTDPFISDTPFFIRIRQNQLIFELSVVIYYTNGLLGSNNHKLGVRDRGRLPLTIFLYSLLHYNVSLLLWTVLYRQRKFITSRQKTLSFFSAKNDRVSF